MSSEEEIIIDEENNNIPIIIDLQEKTEENSLSDINVSDFYAINRKIKLKLFSTKFIDTISSINLGKINLRKIPKIKIFKNKFKKKEDIIFPKSKKTNHINISDFKAKIDENTLNCRDEKQLKTETSIYEQHFDIYNPPRPLSYYIIKKTSKNKEKILKYVFYILSFFILVFSYKTSVLYLVETAYRNIYTITQTKNIEEISKNINNSRFEFIRASYLFAPIDFFFNNSHFSYSPVKNLSNLIEGGKNLSKGLDKSMFVYDSLINLISEKGAENIYYTEFLVDAKPNIEEISFYINKALESYKKVDDLGSAELNETFYKAFVKLNEFSINSNYILDNYDKLLDILAYEKEKKYLVIFQNGDEIRPTGGFMGSMGVLSIFKGKVKDFDKKDVYAYEWKIKSSNYKEKAPIGLSKITDTFGLRDSNYFIDFRDSSEKIKFFMKKAGVNIDGIIYLNNNLILEYLDLVGGMHFNKINKDINSSNFNFIMSTLVESKIFKEGTLDTPKQILFDFMKEFYTKLKKESKYKDYTSLFLDDIKKRDIVFYTFSTKNNIFLNNYDLIGNIDYNFVDFVYPVFTSIGGNKSDRYMKRVFSKKTSISNCKITNDLTINQTHLFSSSDEISHISFFDEFGITDYNDLLNIQGKGVNKQFVRLVLPKDSKIDEKGINVIEEKDKKIVYFYTNTKPGETTSFNLKYEIENKNCLDYDFAFYKQAGLRNYDLNLILPNGKILNNSNLEKDFIYKN
ncbi:MAG: DUF4012 domain-containing protein [Candidatus Gracilibacteria bacterium]|nr:DUF4012 domain-containing protein [Candidatus Gracilibacteria bacterium]